MSALRLLAAALVAGLLSACISRSVRVEPAAAAGGNARQRIAELLLRNPEFGSISILPVRFEDSRISGPIEDKGRTYYCVTTRMLGRNFGRAERRRALVRQDTRPDGVTFSASAHDDGICSGHKRDDFPELEEAANRGRKA